jgi:hypothetical protein
VKVGACCQYCQFQCREHHSRHHTRRRLRHCHHPDPVIDMNAAPLPQRALDSPFWFRIGAAVLLLCLAAYALLGGVPGHPIYALALVVLALSLAARTAATYQASRRYRDVYLVLSGLAFGMLLAPHLMRWLGG